MSSSLVRVSVAQGRLVVTPDNTTAGSEGRVYLQFPPELADEIGGNTYRAYGSFGDDNAVFLVRNGNMSRSITPRLQMWWKNGVRDHNIRENWFVKIYVLEHGLLVVVLDKPTGEPKPKLPPRQDVVFG